MITPSTSIANVKHAQLSTRHRASLEINYAVCCSEHFVFFMTIVTGTQCNEGWPQGMVHLPNGGSLLQWEQVGGAVVKLCLHPL